jgi:hypothetical protein
MRYKILLSLVTIVSFSQAMEFRVSSGTFNWEMSMPFMSCNFDLDTNIYSITEQHNNFSDSKIYYFYNADIYQSDYMDKITTFITRPLTHDFPVFGSFNDAVAKYTSIPVPADYKIRGFDLNLGIGYDVLKNNKGIIGIGINTGISIPVMKMKNMKQSAEVTYRMLEKTETSITTYKLGPIIHLNYEMAPKLLIYGSFSTGIQTGTIENDWIKSSFDVDGSYTTLDLGLRFTPWSSTKDLGWIRLDPKLFFTIGYSYKKWDMDEAKINTFNIAEFSSGGMVKSSFDTNYLYVGAGYDF